MSPAITIRPTGRRQWGTLCRLEAHCFGWERVLVGVWRRVGEQGVSAWMAHVDGVAAGFLIAYPHALDGIDQPYVAALGVATTHRRRGVARALLCAMLAAHDAAWLHVRASNAAAIAAYSALHFVVVRRVAAYYRDGEDAYVMKADVVASADVSDPGAMARVE
jgi:ribosomal protein S18 acetylase RimI-like enzyme